VWNLVVKYTLALRLRDIQNYGGLPISDSTLRVNNFTLPMTKSKLPKKLYKYRAFNVNTLRLLTTSEAYYADPKQLNDPLDCKPTIQIDADRLALEKLCYHMLKKAYDKKIEAAHDAYSKILRIDDSKLPETNNSKEYARKQICEHRYFATQYGKYDDNHDGEEYYKYRLISVIKDILYEEIGEQGVLSLSEKWNCPLMWSHYADEHRGLCIEYDMTDHDCKKIKAVDYKQPRSIKVSDIIAWKKHSIEAEKVILNTFFYSKAPQWRYEKEWRDIDKSGVNSAPFKISAIYFGFGCDASIITSIVKLLAGTPVKFYNMFIDNISFDLKRRIIDTGEIEACGLKSPDFISLKGLYNLDESDT
jgi:hypothetical protein